jgi:uncharacterized phage-associated protein
MPVSAMIVAHYFLAKRDPEAGDEISNLKLQKLLYYAQGLHLALTGEPLFPETIEAWQHGPVVPPVYHACKRYGERNLPQVEANPHSSLTAEQRRFLDDVYEVYGQFSAWKLREMTHDEAPWKDAEARGPSTEITHQALRDFFVTRVEP